MNVIISIDRAVNAFFQDVWTDLGKDIFVVIAWLGDVKGVMLLGFFVGLYLLYTKKLRELFVFTGTVLLGAASIVAIKYSVERARPENMIIDYGGFSFPSGHSVMAVIFYGLLYYFFVKNIKSRWQKHVLTAFCISFAVLILLSRLYLSVHWLSDVVAGVILGLFWFTVGIWGYRKISK